ncbi:MAG TPA: hypothetical protein VHV77_00355, partial [Pirellulales bacterium]|nr:hypothetical protein [Pirellulales bacterium]
MSHLRIMDDNGCEPDCTHATHTKLSGGRALEHFIPIRKAQLIDQLCQQPGLSTSEADGFRRLCQLLDSTLHFEYHTHLEALKTAYASFDPDADTRENKKLDRMQQHAQLDVLFDRFTWLLERANFRKLSHDDIEQALAAASHQGLSLEVDFDFFDRL